MIRRRWLWLLLALPLLAGLARLRFDVEVLNLLPAELPEVRGLQLHQRHFANARELLITVRGDDPEQVAAAAQAIATRLAAQSDLVRSARWQPPWLEHPADAAENLAWLWLQQPPEEFARLAARLAPANLPAELAAAREALASSLDPQELARRSYDPLGFTQLPAGAGDNRAAGFDTGTGIFANADGTFRLVFVEPARPQMNYREATAWFAAVQSEADAALTSLATRHSPLEISHTGGPAFLAEIAGGMESDLRNSVLGTLAVIATLFWLAHRSWRPLAWLVVSLGLTLALTLALGGLVFGSLNVVSLGFAAILMGLAVDYGLVSYQEAVASPVEPLGRIRHAVTPGITYSAATTAGTFLLLGFAGLPGLTQLGALTALGLGLGAFVMLRFFLPRVVAVGGASSLSSRGLRAHLATGPVVGLEAPRQTGRMPLLFFRRLPLVATLLLVAGILLTLTSRGLPRLTASTKPLRPRQSRAYAAMEELKSALGRTNEPQWLIFSGTNELEVARQLAATQTALAAAQARGEVTSFTLPSGFWPHPDHAAENLPSVAAFAAQADGLRAAALAAGFTTGSLALTDGILKAWRAGSAGGPPAWPTNATARWLTSQFAARTPEGRWLALGFVEPTSASGTGSSGFRVPSPEFGLPATVLLTSWESLGAALLAHVSRRVAWLTALIAATLVGCLWLAFRRWQEVVLSLAALTLSFALLLAVMALCGGSWNLLNLVALPLLLGSSVDSAIHIQLALRRDARSRRGEEANPDATGNIGGTALRSTRKALLLCAGANIAGFGSLAWSSNAGLASLDLVCAGGVACVFVVCVGLLPLWWRAVCGTRNSELGARNSPAPSSLYGPWVWRAGLGLGRVLPEPLIVALARGGAFAYRLAKPARFAVVVENLLPVFADDRRAATAAARDNFAQFARKLADLWRYEAGVPVGDRVRAGSGWEHFLAARDSGRGVLLVTPHLGNWEFGAPLLARHGVRPLVLTAAEPGGGFTELRAAARARHGVDTLVVGADPFAFVEVIRRLQDGGVVALLLDRPPAGPVAEVTFFGRPFRASLAAAELARATGCVVLPVFIVREGDGHLACALPAVDYDRRVLADRAARADFTGKVLRCFAPAVRQFAAQWFHFVPVWPVGEQGSRGEREQG